VDDLTVTCRLTACTPGSAPGPTLGIEYGKPLPLPLTCTRRYTLPSFAVGAAVTRKSSLEVAPTAFATVYAASQCYVHAACCD